jgi:type IV pilus assembly protein PilO
MPDLRHTRKQLKMTLGILGAVSVAAAILYFSPVVGSAESRRMELNQLQAKLTIKARKVAPLKDLPTKIDTASHQIGDFYKDRFPSTNSQILTEVGKLASENGVTIEQGRYKPSDEVTAGLQPIEMEYDLSGNYGSLARFINAMERDQMFFIINSVTLNGEPQGAVKLSVKLQTYLKVGA